MCCHVEPLAGSSALHCSSSLRCVNKDLARDNDTIIVRASIAAWLNASHRRRGGLHSNDLSGSTV